MSVAGVPAETADTAVLLLSELATNAVLHTPSGDVGGRFAVRAFFLPGRLRVEVRDEGGAPFQVPSTAPEPAPDAEHGRGLLLVATLAYRWGRFTSRCGAGTFFELLWDTGTAAPAVPMPEEVRP
ncbi:anti-sigma regulatory factor (Ser/Thr protein kinase) [Streptomonospora salina]|uniref:Anti-sigma regulatory factor (Ser/Thr protein kinase) n=2 Tax=Streptomonospora salina TaxID=104205 RepID=A0A841E5P8_9ACTN|nr:anti-sigma regulatory factor (Ser/Thr protein kinase) [Streptomonospora salina]